MSMSIPITILIFYSRDISINAIVIALFNQYGRSKMYEEQYEETIGIYIDAIIRYVFGEQ